MWLRANHYNPRDHRLRATIWWWWLSAPLLPLQARGWEAGEGGGQDFLIFLIEMKRKNN